MSIVVINILFRLCFMYFSYFVYLITDYCFLPLKITWTSNYIKYRWNYLKIFIYACIGPARL